MKALDANDRNILRLLRVAARMSNVALAGKVGLPAFRTEGDPRSVGSRMFDGNLDLNAMLFANFELYTPHSGNTPTCDHSARDAATATFDQPTS